MDPNHWNTYNQAYSRLSSGPGMTTNPRIDLSLLEQSTLASQGLGALSPPLPAHTTLSPPRPLAGLPSVNYTHPALGTMSQFLDSVTSLATSQQSPYKTVTVGQPAYSLESPNRMQEGRLSMTTSPAAISKALSFTDHHVAKDLIPSYTTTPSPTSIFSDNTKAWGLTNFVPVTTMSGIQYSGDHVITTGFTPSLEPPPAHSGSQTGHRASTIQRNPYKEYTQTALQPAHSRGSRNNQTPYSMATEREPPTAHSHYTSFDHNDGARTVSSQPQSRVNNHHSYPNSPQLTQQSQQTPHGHSPFSYSPSMGQDGTSSLSYEAVSPAGPIPDSHTNDSFNTAMSLQDLADISSNQEKLPLQERRGLSSPHGHMRSPQGSHMVGSMSEPSTMAQLSPMTQQSPVSVSVSSPQVGMSLGSPQHASSTVQPPPIPVQAVPDSTTRPKRRTRKRKDKDAAPVIEHMAPTTFEVAQPPSGSVVTLAQDELYQHEQAPPGMNPMFQVQGSAAGHIPNPQFTDVPTSQTFSSPSTSTLDFTSSDSVMPQKDVLAADQVFMTNTFGNAFVNPNTALGTIPGTEPKPDPMDYMEMKPKPRRTKAQQKAMPPMQRPTEIDDEFAHLVEPPEIQSSQKLPNDVNKSESEAAQPASTSAFQSSFLSFLQGKKPETLSSVTNSNTPRPPMPKYVPDPRPVIPFSTQDREKSSKIDIPAVAFSDDEDTEGNVKEALRNVISNLSGEDSSSSATVDSIPTLVVRRGRGKGRSRGRGRITGLKKRKASWDAGDDDEFNPEGSGDEAIKTQPAPKKKAPSPLPLRERTSRKAKVKVEEKRKERQARKKTPEGKKEKQRNSKAEDSGSGLEDYASLSSEEDEPEEKDYDSDRDPAWRPTSLPDIVTGRVDSDDEDGNRRSMGGRGKRFRTLTPRPGRGRPSLRGRGGQTVYRGVPATTIEPKTTTTAPVEAPVPEPVHMPSDDDNDEEPVHKFTKGEFVLEKKDLKNYDSYPIWKIDAGRLLQKYELLTKDGRKMHQSMSTYSSWSESVRHHFRAIKVRLLYSNRGQPEQVEVLEEFRPKQPEESPEDDDDLISAFNVYMQILISQALEPGFLAAINEEKDDYYHGPLQQLDKIIADHATIISDLISWTKDFQRDVERFPDLNAVDRSDTAGSCQASTAPDVPSVKQATFTGKFYNRDTLEAPSTEQTEHQQEYVVGQEVMSHLPTYHGLYHFRYNLYLQCSSKVTALKEGVDKLENRDVLDHCLQNRLWVQKLYRDLKELLSKASACKEKS